MSEKRVQMVFTLAELRVIREALTLARDVQPREIVQAAHTKVIQVMTLEMSGRNTNQKNN